MNKYYWRIGDGRIWGSDEARWMDESEIPMGKRVQTLLDSGEPATVEYLKTTIKFYGYEMSELADLADVKAAKKAAIDANTNRLRDRDGLSYSGERFAMTEGAKLNWTGMLAASAMLPLPMNILTIDDKPFQIADKNALMAFLMAVMAYDTAEGSPITSGRALRMQVEAATTVEEVNAIVDDRE